MVPHVNAEWAIRKQMSGLAYANARNGNACGKGAELDCLHGFRDGEAVGYDERRYAFTRRFAAAAAEVDSTA